jgi:hypothetical protein
MPAVLERPPAPPEDRRRDPTKVRFDAGAKRATDPVLTPEDCHELALAAGLVDDMTTADCAKDIGGGLTVKYILGEIKAGRLIAWTIAREGKRTQYRVSKADWDTYRARYRWMRDVDRRAAG